MKIEDLELGRGWEARLLENNALTPPEAKEEVRELVLESDQPESNLRAGQSVGVLVAGPHDLGQRNHVRLYTIAKTPAELGAGRFSLCVRRCSFLDPFSGERFPGIASNYLCDLPVDSALTLGGPIGLPFVVPEDRNTPLLIVGLGTGIAPFRGLIQELFEQRSWRGKVMLFHGARVGLEAVYRDAIAEVCQRSDAFSPVQVVSARPAWGDPADLADAISRHRDEVWELLSEPDVHVYLAGLTWVGKEFDKAMIEAAGGGDVWAKRKAEIKDAGRWMSLLY